MTLVERQLAQLVDQLPYKIIGRLLPSGAFLIEIASVKLPPGWNRTEVDIAFLAPAGYPASRPDCFWAAPAPVRKLSAITAACNDANPMPEVGLKGTWFSWHVQVWNPNRDSLLTFFHTIMRRFDEVQ